MNDVAIDTNILLYALDDFYPAKQKVAVRIMAAKPLFCSQSLSEFINVCVRKWKFPKSKVADLVKTYLQQCVYIPVSERMLTKSINLIDRYNFQFFDAIIIAAALDSGCTTLYSEDMSNGQIVNGQLKIVNPF